MSCSPQAPSYQKWFVEHKYTICSNSKTIWTNSTGPTFSALCLGAGAWSMWKVDWFPVWSLVYELHMQCAELEIAVSFDWLIAQAKSRLLQEIESIFESRIVPV